MNSRNLKLLECCRSTLPKMLNFLQLRSTARFAETQALTNLYGAILSFLYMWYTTQLCFSEKCIRQSLFVYSSSPPRSVQVVFQTSYNLVIGEEGHVAWMRYC